MKQKQKNKSEGLATKKDLKVLEKSLRGGMRELKGELGGEVRKMREEHKIYKDEVLTKLDDISGQLEGLQEDKVLSIHQTSQLNDKVDNHEVRIKHLEKIQQTA